jgi:hypothetical protein
MDAGTLLLGHDGVYVEGTLNGIPAYGARWDGGVPYSDDGAGTPLTEQPSLLSQPALTNVILDSSDQTTVNWNRTGITANRNRVGLTGSANTATLCEAANSSSYLQFSIGGAGVVRVYAKAEGSTWLHVLGTGVNQYAQFNLNDGTVLRTGGGAVGAEIRDIGNGVYECLAEFSASTNTRFYPKGSEPTDTATGGGTAGDVVILNAERYDNKTIAEVAGSSPIITEGSTVSQGVVTLAYDIANNNDTKGAWYVEYTPLSDVDNTLDPWIIGSRSNRGIMYWSVSSQLRSQDDASLATAVVSPVFSANNYRKLGYAYGGTKRLTVDGVSGTELAHTGGQSDAALFINTRFNATGGQGPLSAAVVRNIRRYDVADFTEAKDVIDDLMS